MLVYYRNSDKIGILKEEITCLEKKRIRLIINIRRKLKKNIYKISKIFIKKLNL